MKYRWKKILYLVAVWLLAFSLTQIDAVAIGIRTSSMPGNQEILEGKNVFRLPASVQVIEEEAFDGTAPTYIYALDDLERIENAAFSNTLNLKEIYLPTSLSHISENAFYGVNSLVVHSAADSYAEKWAAEQGFTFVVQREVPAMGPQALRLLKLQCVLLPVSALLYELTRRRPIENCTDHGIQNDPKERMGMPVLELVFP